MDPVLRAAAIYVSIMVLARISGRRTLAQATIFDLILLLIAAEAVGEALTGGDNSVTNAIIVVTTLFGLDILMSFIKDKFPFIAMSVDGQPMVILRDGELLHDRLRKARIDADDVLEEARMSGGPTAIEDIRYAILERNGKISIIPK